ncbi:FAA hydrolase family protein [Xylanimonas allomyrinae]|uniref:FAA hydrolase family protein n=1 Tax=Xylanimonas allomyrinae TaxID=2509459 RepID=A0A4V0YEJ2_9MICO|nr:fumarylacetoacetate hydrolase family protein [Xylanimonas allomyrinae]QAY64401.1 FAA hydrolase family protein [Xylanimonas allomyrinae]
MRLATVTTLRGTSAAVETDDGWRALPAPDLSALLARGGAWQPGEVLAEATPTLPLPRPGKVICCGLNYGDHIAETGRDMPAYPTLFAKHADTLLADGQDIRLPAGLQVDWEAELAVVVGRELRRASEDEARAAVAGYTVANDISVRDWQRRTPQWFQGKNWDATTPLGPVVVTPDEADPQAGLDVLCRVNGVERQRGSTRTLVFPSAALLAYASTFTVLRPGDIVLTGTPGGVGMGMTPPLYLRDGDVVETEIPGIGTLTNTLRLA